jgi:hypothetical protein
LLWVSFVLFLCGFVSMKGFEQALPATQLRLTSFTHPPQPPTTSHYRSSSNTTRTYCENGVCRFVPTSGCFNSDSKCGRCVGNCGGAEKDSICKYYWNNENVCTGVSAELGGGSNPICGGNTKCCVITSPDSKVVRPVANECLKQY